MSAALTLRPSCDMADRRHAARPAACGAAMLVPPLISSPVFQRGTDENATPGATRSGFATSAPRELHHPITSGDAERPFPRMSVEAAVRARPDVIVVCGCGT